MLCFSVILWLIWPAKGLKFNEMQMDDEGDINNFSYKPEHHSGI